MRSFIIILSIACFAITSHAQWLDDVRLTFNPSESRAGVQSVASFGPHIFTVWRDSRDGVNEVYYCYSSNFGETWGKNIRVTNNASSSWPPMVIVANSEVFVFWYDVGSAQIKLTSTTDYGATWSNVVGISNKPIRPENISIAAFNDKLYVACLASGNQSLYLLRSTDLGKTWGSEVTLARDTAGTKYMFDPYIHADDSNAVVMWRQGAYLYMVKSSDFGQRWGNIEQVTSNDFGSREPTFHVVGNSIFLVYVDVGNINDSLFTTFVESPDLGVTWVKNKRLSVIPSVSVQLLIEKSDSALHIVWVDESTCSYVKSNDFGTNWSSEMILSSSAGGSRSLSSNSKSLYLSWSDSRSGNSEVYFKKNPNANKLVTSSVEPTKTFSRVFIQPSPASDMLTISIGDTHAYDVKIVDVNGKSVWSGSINGEAKIDISLWGSGIYFLQSGKQAIKFIKG